MMMMDECKLTYLLEAVSEDENSDIESVGENVYSEGL